MNNPNPKFYFLLIVIFSLSINHKSLGQNLLHTTNENIVPNPSFERTNPAIKKLNHAMRNFGIIADWKPLVNSPDAHHPYVQEVDFNHKSPRFLSQFGSQQSRTGEGKVGMYIAGGAYKEGIIAKLNRNLSPGKYYYFQMYASPGEGVSKSCTSSIGAYFSARIPKITPTTKLRLHVKSSELICDTQVWTKVCGIYKASGKEKYISLGYFGDSPNGKSLRGSGAFSEAYYYMDDVLLIEMQDPKGIDVNAICGMVLDFSDIEFLEGESEAYEEIKKALDSYIQYVKIFKVNKIQITGHSDDAGTSFENEIMSAVRASNVKAYMIEKGVDENLIEVIFAGDTQPVVTDESSSNLDITSNNRVSINIE
ncbi:OmpA family protein [Aquimarina sp. 2201CG5-10]|uniref:OmpA family protein n=1 Tax=Aquimarina callyspongiae TaxID=3098150 RepID=UPI002AB365A0|nr:OmpA family protein [Aquimarina sp. 2201CG5-10]MDY8134115.1 OmpA family protein [Aquimarina sp. 2201CG5-10]